MADLDLYIHAVRANRWDQAKDAWLCIILGCDKSLLVASRGEEQFFFPTAMVGGVSCVGWPAERVVCGNETYFRPQENCALSDLKWLHVWDLEEWEAVSLVWVGPLHVCATSGRPSTMGPLGLPDRERRGLWQVAAQKGFWQLGKTPMVQLAKHMGVQVSVGCSLFEVVRACVEHALPGLSAEEMAMILRGRTAKSFVYEEFLKGEDAIDLLEQGEQKPAKDVVEDTERSKADLSD